MSGEGRQVPEDVYAAVVENLKIDLRNARNAHTYVVVERNWYRGACEAWLRHSDGCAADIGDEYRCRCGLRKWLAEDKRRRETVYKEANGDGV